MMLLQAIQLLLVLLAQRMTEAVKCSSRFYCRTPEIKYMAMEKKSGVYLNIGPITSHTAKNITHCQTFCIRENRCKSLNLKIGKMEEKKNCMLIYGNMYKNRNELVADKDFIHLYIPSKCKSSPCANGATCIPQYGNDSYSCECKGDRTFITKGKHCEIVQRGYDTALQHLSFNGIDNKLRITGSDSVSVLSHIFAKEPGRKSNVMNVDKGYYIVPVFATCLSSFSRCGARVTYSIWIKLRKKQNVKDQRMHIIRTGGFESLRGIDFSAFQKSEDGFYFAISLTTSKRWILANFGKYVNRQHWNQFTFSVAEDMQACVYVNGAKEMCQHSSTSVSLSSNNAANFTVGYKTASGSFTEMFADDFAVWQLAFNDAEARSLYDLSK